MPIRNSQDPKCHLKISWPKSNLCAPPEADILWPTTVTTNWTKQSTVEIDVYPSWSQMRMRMSKID